jgi:hypothetical protein
MQLMQRRIDLKHMQMIVRRSFPREFKKIKNKKQKSKKKKNNQQNQKFLHFPAS